MYSLEMPYLQAFLLSTVNATRQRTRARLCNLLFTLMNRVRIAVMMMNLCENMEKGLCKAWVYAIHRRLASLTGIRVFVLQSSVTWSGTREGRGILTLLESEWAMDAPGRPLAGGRPRCLTISSNAGFIVNPASGALDVSRHSPIQAIDALGPETSADAPSPQRKIAKSGTMHHNSEVGSSFPL